MQKKQERGAKKDPSRLVLGMALALLGMGVLLLVLSLSLGSNPAMQAVSRGLRMSVPYVLLFGFGLLVAYAVLRPAPDPGSDQQNEPTLFGSDTTAFESRLEIEDEESSFAYRGERPPATAWSAQVFEDIEWRRFEALCASLFAQTGLVQCKHWLGKPVGVEEMREFHGVMASNKLERGTYATTSTFTEEARRFAKDNGISALDGQGLLDLISTRTPAQQEFLLAIAYEGEYWRPTCARCGVKMVERSARGEGRSFWGCVHFPRCRFTLPVGAPGV
jgi:restriction system protein